MKKRWIVAALAACSIALVGCKIVSEPEPIAVQSVTLNETTLTLEYGDTKTLTATVLPENADNRTVTWYSSTPEVADVDYWGGVVTAHSEGTTTISAYAGSRMASCEVTVKRKEVAVDSITLNADTLTLVPAESRILTATAHPYDADDKTATWSSSDTSVAMVDSNGISAGIVTAIGPGTAIITAQIGDCTALCTVYVNETLIEQPDNPVAVEVESITLNTETLMLAPGKSGTLEATVMPYNAEDKTVVWTTSSYWVATVDSDGTVTACNIGTAIISAYAGDKKATCTVTVEQILVPVEGITLDHETLTINRGEEFKLTARVTPSNAEYTSVIWRSSDWEIADVDTWSGIVMARKAGTATITATTEEGGFTATCEVTVNPMIPIESFKVRNTELMLVPGDTEWLSVLIEPSDADETTVEWSSSDDNIVTVGEYDNRAANITAHNVGTATITATACVGGKTAECEVTVHKHSYKDGKCIVCGKNPYMKDGVIDKNGVLVRYSGSESSVNIPDGVTGIGRWMYGGAFEGCRNLTSVTIPNSVKSIGDSAFSGCYDLNNVTIPDSVTTIGNAAFYNCSCLTSVEIPNSVKSIGDSAFYGCQNLNNVTIPDSVTTIGNSAFNNCSRLTSVEIPNSVTSFGEGVFRYCKCLTNVTIPSCVTSIEERAFLGCTKLKSVNIPASVMEIGDKAFFDCKDVTSVKYGGTLADWCGINFLSNPLTYGAVLYIDGKAMTNAVIPNSVTSIKANAFLGYKSLESVTIPGSVTSIGESAFKSCENLTSVTIDNGVTSIGQYAFYNCPSLTSVTIPASVTSIETYAFYSGNKDMNVTYYGTWSDWNGIKKGKFIFADGVKITGKNGSTFIP